MSSATSLGTPNEELLRFFSRHIVAIYLTLDGDEGQQHPLYTGFVLSVHDQWLLITAGHVITEIDDAGAHGYHVTKCRLIDTLGEGAAHRAPIVFDWNAAKPIAPFTKPEYDYGIIFLDHLTVEQLKANNVRALDEKMWQYEPPPIEGYGLVGVAAEFSETTAKTARVTTTFHRIQAFDERPEQFVPVDAPMFYGRIQLAPPMTTIRGLSGGPIFAFWSDDEGQRYCLHAIQSGWIKDLRYISACLIKPFAELIKEVMEGRFIDEGPSPA